MNELISVVIPAYNVAPYIEKCLGSVLDQVNQSIEIIIVDDGSTDRSGEIAQSYADRYPDKIKIIHQKNSGVTTARINGVEASSGKWIGFVDADDEIEPDMYERLLKNALENDADISHCGYRTIVEGRERAFFYNTGQLLIQDRESALKSLLAGEFEPSLCTKLYKKELISAVINENKIDKSIKYNEDLLMNYYLFLKAKKSVLEDFCGYHYVARESSATRSSFRIESTIDPVRVSKMILDSVTTELKSIAWSNYLRCSLNAYISIYDCREYKEQAAELKQALCGNQDKWSLLSRNERIKLKGILTVPKLFKKLYRFYEKHFQKKLYG